MAVNSLVIHAQPLGSIDTNKADQTLTEFCQAIQDRHNRVTLIKQLLHMTSAVQLHRGMSMSLLAGSRLFAGDIQLLQSELEKRLTIIETFVGQRENLLNDQAKQNLQQAWLTIRNDWHDDTLIDNFELQSHFIDQLIYMIDEIAQQVAKPLSPPLQNEQSKVTNAESNFKIIELLHFLSPQLIQLIELLAKIRGLATHSASLGRTDYVQDRKLRYLVQCAKENNERTRHQAKRLSNMWGSVMPCLNDIATAEMKVLFLFNTVEADILSGTKIDVESHHLFKIASEIIDIYFNVADKGWDLIRSQFDDDMEAWIRSGSSGSGSPTQSPS